MVRPLRNIILKASVMPVKTGIQKSQEKLGFLPPSSRKCRSYAGMTERRELLGEGMLAGNKSRICNYGLFRRWHPPSLHGPFRPGDQCFIRKLLKSPDSVASYYGSVNVAKTTIGVAIAGDRVTFLRQDSNELPLDPRSPDFFQCAHFVLNATTLQPTQAYSSQITKLN